jgi:hypothetical protein
MRIVHTRRFPLPAAAAGRLIDQLASPEDVLWPSPPWPALRLDRPLGVGATGGHGPIRYTVIAYEPRKRLELEFTPAMKMRGTHTFTVEGQGDRACVLTHVLEGQPAGSMRLVWPLVIRWLHDACLEDLLDNAEEALTGSVASPARWSPWVRFLFARMATRRARTRFRALVGSAG